MPSRNRPRHLVTALVGLAVLACCASCGGSSHHAQPPDPGRRSARPAGAVEAERLFTSGAASARVTGATGGTAVRISGARWAPARLGAGTYLLTARVNGHGRVQLGVAGRWAASTTVGPAWVAVS